MTIAIGLVTCGREAYTEVTLSSLAKHNSLSRFILLHADDASETGDNIKLARSYGFDEAAVSLHRVGQFCMLRELLRIAQHRDAEWFMWLENDWEFVAPIPTTMVSWVYADCLRLYGARKARSGPRQWAGEHMMETRDKIDWRPAAKGYEVGTAHWAGPPSITSIGCLLEVIDRCQSLKDVSTSTQLLTWRPTRNVVWHIGEERTPGFLP